MTPAPPTATATPTGTRAKPAAAPVPVDQAVAAASRLVARTRRIPDDVSIDLLAVGGANDAMLWHREGFALAGRGVALRLLLPAEGPSAGPAYALVAEALRAIPTTDDVGAPGCGPVVLAALPFDRKAAAVLTVPETVVGRDADGHRWLTTVRPAGADEDDELEPSVLDGLCALPAYTPPDSFSLVSERHHAEWSDLIASTVAAVRSGRFAKVVVAREVRVEANQEFLPADILRRLQALYPSCMLFSTGTFLGASPELLVSRFGRRVKSHPLAGTVARSGDPEADGLLTIALLASTKDREEHRLVVDEIAATLGPLCQSLGVPDAPSIVPLRNVSHLGTLIQGQLASDDITALDLVARLHPTPAVGGIPTDEAVAYIDKVEGFDRGFYAGPVGWMDRRGDGEWAVAVRSAEVHGHTARLFAGVGVVADSDPAEELAETQLKLQALLAAVVRP